MVDVAQRAGVSLKTVSRVVNGSPQVQPELADRVRAAIAELGFRRNQLASALRSGQTTATIGLLIEEIANPFYATIADAVAEVSRSHDTLLITASSEEDPAREEEVLRDLCARRVDGLVIVPAGFDHSFLRDEVERGLPVVFLDRPVGGLVADTVLLDNRGGTRSGVERLLTQGHRRIAVLFDEVAYTMRERLEGAREAFAGVGERLDDALVCADVSDPRSAAERVARLAELAEPPTAYVCLNNRITVGALQELWRRGGDAELLGFDDFELSYLMPRPFTVIAYDLRQLAARAAELLFARIAGDTSWPRTEVLPTYLVERGLR
ncbi:MAG: LacI family DNA-binding transcriptional regulator [Hamadaea sp.]|nr:LacI family DNA-binding transcriptional regulator [Hamadaea sp.]